MDFRFKPAASCEFFVFGAARPGYPAPSLDAVALREWLSFMQAADIRQVCCLLSRAQLDSYALDVLAHYRQVFDPDRVCHAPIADYHLADRHTLKDQILPFIAAAVAQGERVVVHCAGGIGRTGHVLAAWLVYGRQFEVSEALAEVRRMSRNPFEAVEGGNATRAQLYALLRDCRPPVAPLSDKLPV